MTTDKKMPQQAFILFLSQYTNLLEQQIHGVRNTLLNTVNEVMKSVDDISVLTESNRLQSENDMDQMYLNPDPETQVLVQGIQDAVNEVFEQAKKGIRGEVAESNSSDQTDILLQNRLNRLTARFAEGSNKLDQIDDQLKTTLIEIMGALSTEDVIAQRMHNIVMAIRGLQASLSYLLIDYKGRSDGAELNRVMNDLKSYTIRQYTSEDEKKLFYDHFPEAYRKKTAS